MTDKELALELTRFAANMTCAIINKSNGPTSIPSQQRLLELHSEMIEKQFDRFLDKIKSLSPGVKSSSFVFTKDLEGKCFDHSKILKQANV